MVELRRRLVWAVLSEVEGNEDGWSCEVFADFGYNCIMHNLVY